MRFGTLEVQCIDRASQEVAELYSIPLAGRTRIEVKNAERCGRRHAADFVGRDLATIPEYIRGHMRRGATATR